MNKYEMSEEELAKEVDRLKGDRDDLLRVMNSDLYENWGLAVKVLMDFVDEESSKENPFGKSPDEWLGILSEVTHGRIKTTREILCGIWYAIYLLKAGPTNPADIGVKFVVDEEDK